MTFENRDHCLLIHYFTQIQLLLLQLGVINIPKETEIASVMEVVCFLRFFHPLETQAESEDVFHTWKLVLFFIDLRHLLSWELFQKTHFLDFDGRQSCASAKR